MRRLEKDGPTTTPSAVRKLVRSSPSAGRILTRIATDGSPRQSGGSSAARPPHGPPPRQPHPWPTLISVIRRFLPVCDQNGSTIPDPNSLRPSVSPPRRQASLIESEHGWIGVAGGTSPPGPAARPRGRGRGRGGAGTRRPPRGRRLG